MTNTTAPTSIQIVNVTPELARKWLGCNLNNRGIRKSVVNKYVNDMTAGRWSFAGDPIRFGSDGTLYDGQHRCQAVAQMPDGFSVPMAVITGLAPDAQRVMDQGSKRSGSDQLKIAGFKNTAILAAAGRLVLLFDEGVYFRDRHIWQEVGSVPAIEEWVVAHPYEAHVIDALSGYARRCDALPSGICAAGVLISRVAPFDLVEEFIGYVADGGAKKTSGPNVLRNRFSAARRSHIEWSVRDVMANTIRAWNAWISGKTTQLGDPHHTQKGRKGWDESSFPTPVYR